MSLQREMSGIEQMNLCIREIALISGSTSGQKCRIMTTPDGEKRRTVLTKVGLEGWIERDVAAVIEDQIELDLLRPSRPM
jgi:hypothetical protein